MHIYVRKSHIFVTLLDCVTIGKERGEITALPRLLEFGSEGPLL
jgi:hypothetical protein